MKDVFADAAHVMDVMCKPLGNLAPRRRRLIADYKDSTGRDLHQDLMTMHDCKVTDAALVESVRAELAQVGCKLTALTELSEGGGVNYLYLDPETLKETVRQLGLQVPANPAAALKAAGVHPVNWKELTHGG